LNFSIPGAKAWYEKKDEAMPALDELLKLRQEPLWDQDDKGRIVNNDGFIFLVSFMFGSLIGKRQWNKDKFTERVSQEMTTSDEAFVLLVLENNWDILNDVDNAEAKFTGRTITTNRRNDGWSNEGISRYNDLVKFVKKNRKREYSRNVEVGVMNLLYEQEKGVDARRKREAEHEDDPDKMRQRKSKKQKSIGLQEPRIEPVVNLDDSSDEEEFASVARHPV
jgi:hypothetical protein